MEVVNAKDIDVITPRYYLAEYSDNYFKSIQKFTSILKTDTKLYLQDYCYN